MKRIVDIPEDAYTRLFDNGIQDNEIAVDDVCEMARAIRLGKPLSKNATNGEILCMLFPNMHYTLSDESPRVITTIGGVSSFDVDWWNALYKGESEDM